MRTANLCGIIVICVSTLMLSGCGEELQNLRIQNARQEQLIKEYETNVSTMKLEVEQLQNKLSTAEETKQAEMVTLKADVAALEEDVAAKATLIKSMQERLLSSGGQLPVELTSKLEELANKYPMISYDADRGVLKFESDLTFERGSDQVTGSAADAVKSLCTILDSDQAKEFDVVVAGHTDDIPIQRAETLAQHPSNWHLSAHRGISVINIMTANGVDPKRLSVRGFGEYHPIEPNKPNHQGNAKNRRVEIFIIPKGM